VYVIEETNMLELYYWSFFMLGALSARMAFAGW
jgi:hypothetical protein